MIEKVCLEPSLRDVLACCLGAVPEFLIVAVAVAVDSIILLMIMLA